MVPLRTNDQNSSRYPRKHIFTSVPKPMNFLPQTSWTINITALIISWKFPTLIFVTSLSARTSAVYGSFPIIESLSPATPSPIMMFPRITPITLANVMDLKYLIIDSVMFLIMAGAFLFQTLINITRVRPKKQQNRIQSLNFENQKSIFNIHFPRSKSYTVTATFHKAGHLLLQQIRILLFWSKNCKFKHTARPLL